MPVLRVDDDVIKALKKKAIELDLIFSTPNQVLRTLLCLDVPVQQERNHVMFDTSPQLTHAEPIGEERIFTSADPKVRQIIDEFLPHLQNVLSSSKDYLQYYPISGRWISHPNNFVAIKIQQARAKDLSVSVYGRPNDFEEVVDEIELKPDRTNYSRFNLKSQTQVSEAIRIIKFALVIKQRDRKR